MSGFYTSINPFLILNEIGESKETVYKDLMKYFSLYWYTDGVSQNVNFRIRDNLSRRRDVIKLKNEPGLETWTKDFTYPTLGLGVTVPNLTP